MADDKKPPAPKATGMTFENVTYTLLGILLIMLALGRLFSGLSSIQISSNVNSEVVGPTTRFFADFLLPKIKFLAFLTAVLAFFGTVWSTIKANKIAAAQKALITAASPEVLTGAQGAEFKNKRWERVMSHINSENQNDWKFAIIEADIILNDLLDSMLYRGETIADKLKKVEPSDFLSLEAAWEAHKVRNMIAHEGTDFFITEREAKRVINLYRSVFEEFHYI